MDVNGTVLSGEALKLANDRLQVVAVGQLEELLDAEIPCGGWRSSVSAHHPCDGNRGATLMATGHGCNGGRTDFKCVQCWQKWLTVRVNHLAKWGLIRCAHCKRSFHDVPNFADYRPF